MKKIYLYLFVIFLSLFFIRETDNTTRYTFQKDFDPTVSVAIFNNNQVPLPSAIAELPQTTKVLGETTGEKVIYVDLAEQRLYALEGDQIVYNFQISSGKFGKTPTGTFLVWSKFRYTRMRGGSVALGTHYDLPNVPYTMFFENDQVPGSRGFSIHGTYWHNNFGHPMSHGCVNMRTSEAALIYNWANPSTFGKNFIRATSENPGIKIVIYGKAPKS